MSGYDLNANPLNLMKGRLGVYDKQTFDLNDYSIDGVREQSIRLHQMGGNK